MSKYIIDTDLNTCFPYVPNDSTIADLMQGYRGTTEYNGIVADIQTWYYGFVSKTSWCATAISYFANKCGILYQLGGKNENVFNMMNACSKSGYGKFFDKDHIPELIKKNDIIFFLWEGKVMTSTSNKHVSVAEYNSNDDTIFCLGGNQKDKICTQKYEREYVYALFRPQY